MCVRKGQAKREGGVSRIFRLDPLFAAAYGPFRGSVFIKQACCRSKISPLGQGLRQKSFARNDKYLRHASHLFRTKLLVQKFKVSWSDNELASVFHLPERRQ